jgi:hypothetical protein
MLRILIHLFNNRVKTEKYLATSTSVRKILESIKIFFLIRGDCQPECQIFSKMLLLYFQYALSF